MTQLSSLTAPLRRGLVLLALLLAAAPTIALAQTGGVRIGTAGTPDNSAVLEVSSTSKGLLPPRLSQAQRDAIANPVAGLTPDTTTGILNTWDGTRWAAALTYNSSPPPVSMMFAYTGGP